MMTDNAANMVAACQEAKNAQSSHGSFSHILNLVLKNGLKKVPTIINAVMAFKRLAIATHKSTLYSESTVKESDKNAIIWKSQ